MIANAKQPYPRSEADAKYRVRGKTAGGEFLQVSYLIEEDRTLYVIHARPLTENEKRQLRRSRR